MRADMPRHSALDRLQVRDGELPIPNEWEGDTISEVYLRVAVSRIARVATSRFLR